MEEQRTLIDHYKTMLRIRHFEEACLEGVPSREIHGELHVAIGQEAIAAAMVGVLRNDDAVVSTHRNHPHAIAKDVPLEPMLAEIYEKETGLCRGRGGHMHLFDAERNFSVTGIVGSSLPVALGYAYAFWMEDSDRVAIGVTGDGGTNNGAFHESLNIAGSLKLPFVVLVENNEWAISVPFGDVCATPTIAERSCAYGAWGRRVNGTDVEEVAEAFAEAVEHARSGQGPAILEATCHRFRGHYEGDADLYRTEQQKEAMKPFDPLLLTRARLLERQLASETELDRLEQESKQEMSELLERVRQAPMPAPEGALDYVFTGRQQ